MRKKILSLVLALTLVIGYAVPVAASTVVSEDPQVQAAYEEYKKVEAALEAKEYGPLKDAYDKVVALTDAFTDEQSDEWNELVDDNVGSMEFLVNMFSAAYIIDAVAKCDAYAADPSVSNALAFVAAYDECLEQGIMISAFYYSDIMGESIEGVYAGALSVLPAAYIMDIYWAYADLAEALELGYYDDDFIETCEAFEAVLDAFNGLSEAELAQLAKVMGLETAQDAWDKIFTDWINANTILELGAVYDPYKENPNAKTAAAFVEEYERVFLSEGFFTEDDRNLYREFFFDIDDLYAEAKALLAAGNKADIDEGNAPDESDGGKSPDTGDDFNAAPFAVVMLMAAAVAGLAVKRKRVN